MSRSPFNTQRVRAWHHWLRSWLRPTVALYLPAQEPEQVFDAWCRAHPGTAVRLLLAGGSTHQALVPSPTEPSGSGWGWLRQLSGRGPAAMHTRAAQDWAQHYGPEANTWPLAIWSGAGLEGSCALRGARLDALRRSAQTCGVRLKSAVPLWAALLPWADAQQPQWWCAGRVVVPAPGEDAADTTVAALAVVEGTLVTWVHCSPGGVRAVQQRRLAAPTVETLEQKILSLRAPQQRVLVAGFGLNAGSGVPAQAHAAKAAQGWLALNILTDGDLPEQVMRALASPSRRSARRWPIADLLHRPGSLGLLGRCMVLAAWLGLAGSAALWQHNHGALVQAQHEHAAAYTSLQSARAAQRNTSQASASAVGVNRGARPNPVDEAQARMHQQARKLMAGLRYAWAGLLLPIEAAAMGNVRWLELDCSTDGGRVRLLGQANTTAAALEAVQTLSERNGWSQVALSKMLDTTARDPQGGVRFELTALYRSAPPAPTAEAL